MGTAYVQDSWSKLNRQQIGKYAEYFAKMEFTKAGFDVYTAEVDDKGIDFVVRRSEAVYYDIQVKSARKSAYVFMKKRLFIPRKNLYLMLMIFRRNEEPVSLLIPSIEWVKEGHPALVDHDYEGMKSEPEYGINITKANFNELIAKYSFSSMIARL
ncbi:MAG: DUF4365 domain-containing protein [Candidatus Zixiibacteriota bacterium]